MNVALFIDDAHDSVDEEVNERFGVSETNFTDVTRSITQDAAR